MNKLVYAVAATMVSLGLLAGCGGVRQKYPSPQT